MRWCLITIFLLLGCKSEPPEPVDRFAGSTAAQEVAVEPEVPPEPEPAPSSDLKWPSDFSKWYDQPVRKTAHLPHCKTDWHVYAIDDEFLVWKCEQFGDTGISDDGEFAVHTRNGRVFMVTISVSFPTEGENQASLKSLREINRDRRIDIDKKDARFITDFWQLGTSNAALSAGNKGYSILYVKSKDQLSEVSELIQRQREVLQLKRPYSLGDLRYTVQNVKRESTVGRGRDRWTAKVDSDFVVVEYEVQNRGKIVYDHDPAVLRLVSGSEVLEPDPRARQAFLDGDRTGQFVLALNPKSKRLRVELFEVPKSFSSRPMALVVAREEKKLIYRVDFAN